jgi:hypothetical protein
MFFTTGAFSNKLFVLHLSVFDQTIFGFCTCLFLFFNLYSLLITMKDCEKKWIYYFFSFNQCLLKILQCAHIFVVFIPSVLVYSHKESYALGYFFFLIKLFTFFFLSFFFCVKKWTNYIFIYINCQRRPVQIWLSINIKMDIGFEISIGEVREKCCFFFHRLHNGYI